MCIWGLPGDRNERAPGPGAYEVHEKFGPQGLRYKEGRTARVLWKLLRAKAKKFWKSWKIIKNHQTFSFSIPGWKHSEVQTFLQLLEAKPRHEDAECLLLRAAKCPQSYGHALRRATSVKSCWGWWYTWNEAATLKAVCGAPSWGCLPITSNNYHFLQGFMEVTTGSLWLFHPFLANVMIACDVFGLAKDFKTMKMLQASSMWGINWDGCCKPAGWKIIQNPNFSDMATIKPGTWQTHPKKTNTLQHIDCFRLLPPKKSQTSAVSGETYL